MKLFQFIKDTFGPAVGSHSHTLAKTTAPVVPRSNAIKISVLNATSMLTDAQIAPVIVALQTQVSRDFAPVYGIDAKLTQVLKGQTADPTSWWLVLSDNSDQAGALGYHDLTPTGLPIGKVFVKSVIDNGDSWSVTISHELLEMLADPWANLTVFAQSSNTAGKLYCWEVCDTCEADALGYQINGIQVSDFAYPGWWGIPGYRGKLDHTGHITKVLDILPGGYIGEFDVTKGNGWTQKTAEGHMPRSKGGPGSRFERRVRGHANWKLSTVSI